MAFLAGMNIDDIKATDCNYISDRLKELMGIELIYANPYGNAIVCLSALINACKVTNRQFNQLKIVIRGIDGAGQACFNLITRNGANKENCFLFDSYGINYQRKDENG